MKFCYICSPYRAKTAGELQKHIEYAQQLTRLALEAGLVPITPHLYITQAVDDTKDDERTMGLVAGLELLGRCEVMLIGSKYGISAGMAAEIAEHNTKKAQIAVTDDGTLTAAELRDILGRIVIKAEAAGSYADMPTLMPAT